MSSIIYFSINIFIFILYCIFAPEELIEEKTKETDFVAIWLLLLLGLPITISDVVIYISWKFNED